MPVIRQLTDTLNGSIDTFCSIALGNWLRYAFVAGVAWLLCYVWFKERWWRRKIIQRDPVAGDLLRELKWSVSTAIIYGLVGTLTLVIGRGGGFRMYRQIDTYGWLWFWLSVVIAVFVHDAYFYWTHRLMHHKRLFRLFHRVHHMSRNPSPWTAYAFGPLEAVVQAGIFPLLAFTLPMHPLAFFAFMICQILHNVAGHTGYEYYPTWLMDSWLGKFLNTPTNHVQHHDRMRGNYGLYFNLWDRLMGTNNPDYESRFREVTRRGNNMVPDIVVTKRVADGCTSISSSQKLAHGLEPATFQTAEVAGDCP